MPFREPSSYLNPQVIWIFFCVIVSTAAIALIAHGATFGIADGDDQWYLVQSARISQDFSSISYPDYNSPRPTVDLVFWLCFEVFGPSPAAFGSVVALFHLVACLALVMVAREMGLGLSTSSLAGVFFLTTTAHFRAIYFISGLSYTLGLTLGLVAVYCYIRGTSLPTVGARLLLTVTMLLAVLAHPALLVLVPFCAFTSYDGTSRKTGRLKRSVRLLWPAAVVSACAVFSLVYFFPNTLQSYHSLQVPSVEHTFKYSLWLLSRLFTTAHWLLVPVYQFPRWELAIGAAILVLALLMVLRRSQPEFHWFLWVLLTILPFVNRAPRSFEEGTSGPSRYLYFSSLGISILLAILVHRLRDALSKRLSPSVGRIAFFGCIILITSSSLVALSNLRAYPRLTAGRFHFKLREPQNSIESFSDALQYATGFGVIDREQTYVELCHSLLIDGLSIDDVVERGLAEFPESRSLVTVRASYGLVRPYPSSDRHIRAPQFSSLYMTRLQDDESSRRLAAETLSLAAEGFHLA